MKFYLNHEKFTTPKSINENEVICLVRGNISILAINEEDVKTVR